MDEIGQALDVENTRSKPVQGVRFNVLTEDGEEIPGPDRREGRLSVMAEFLSTKYVHPDQAKAELWTGLRFRGTWLKTDEVARLEGDGDELKIAVLGKTTDMLLQGGVYHSPRKIDEAARNYPGVADAAGFVRFDKEKRPSFACALVLTQGRLSEKDFFQKMREALPAEFVPATVHLVDALPKDEFDSVNRVSLQRQFSAG
jgi:acyl-coenzyme A synthetase/AMP-(fatty) acid ligase